MLSKAERIRRAVERFEAISDQQSLAQASSNWSMSVLSAWQPAAAAMNQATVTAYFAWEATQNTAWATTQRRLAQADAVFDQDRVTAQANWDLAVAVSQSATKTSSAVAQQSFAQTQANADLALAQTEIAIDQAAEQTVNASWTASRIGSAQAGHDYALTLAGLEATRQIAAAAAEAVFANGMARTGQIHTASEASSKRIEKHANAQAKRTWVQSEASAS